VLTPLLKPKLFPLRRLCWWRILERRLFRRELKIFFVVFNRVIGLTSSKSPDQTSFFGNKITSASLISVGRSSSVRKLLRRCVSFLRFVVLRSFMISFVMSDGPAALPFDSCFMVEVISFSHRTSDLSLASHKKFKYRYYNAERLTGKYKNQPAVI
jgi:hypothetical protein